MSKNRLSIGQNIEYNKISCLSKFFGLIYEFELREEYLFLSHPIWWLTTEEFFIRGKRKEFFNTLFEKYRILTSLHIDNCRSIFLFKKHIFNHNSHFSTWERVVCYIVLLKSSHEILLHEWSDEKESNIMACTYMLGDIIKERSMNLCLVLTELSHIS